MRLLFAHIIFFTYFRSEVKSYGTNKKIEIPDSAQKNNGENRKAKRSIKIKAKLNKETMQGIYSLEDLKNSSISKQNGGQGIYLWGVKHDSRYIPLNVGKHRNIHERIFQHLCRWHGGEYRVPAWDDIINPKPTSPPFVKNASLLYIPHGPSVYNNFLKSTDIQYTIKKVSDNFFCCWKLLPNTLNAFDEEDAFATLINKRNLISSHRKNNTTVTKFAQQFYNEFNKATKKPNP